MKKLYYLCVLFCALSLAACNDDDVSSHVIDDANFREYLLSNFDTNRDGKFSPGEISQARYMDLSYLYISSIKGIGLFNALETLKCHHNQLTELDVSSNKELVYLDCSYNQLEPLIYTACIGKLKYLDYSNNPKLGFYGPRSEAELEYVDMSNSGNSDGSFSSNKKLKYLKCSGVNLNALHIYSCMELIYLDISNNDMSANNPVDLTNSPHLDTLEATNIPNLTTIYIKKGHTIKEMNIDPHIEVIYR